jgi:outer membrane biosynthesis protein TonB
MRSPLIISFFLHFAVIVLAWIGLPSWNNRVIDTPPVIDVTVVTDVSQAPQPVRDPLPQPREVEKPSPPKPKQQASLPPPPAPPPPAPPPPAPPKEAEPVKKEPEPEPKPEPKPEPVAKPEPKPKPEPEPEPEPKKAAEPEVAPAPTPRKKPKPPPEDDFASVLKTVENLKSRPQPKKPEAQEKSFDQAIEDVLKKHDATEPSPRSRQLSSLDPGAKMSMSEIDALRRQIERCWNPPAGAPEAENLVVEVQLQINQDGTVRQAQIVDSSRMYRDSYYRAAAESVLRAVKHPMCTPLKLPHDKYELWRDTKLTFNPRELVGR